MGDPTAMVWKQMDIYSLASMYPTEQVDSSSSVSDSYLEGGKLKSQWDSDYPTIQPSIIWATDNIAK
jgi:hypothetical protein